MRSRPPRRPWLAWGVPAVVAVLLAAVATGVLLRTGRAQSPPPPPSGPRLPAPASPLVRFSPAALEHPDSARVRQVLQIHFDAINLKSYEQWTPTVVERKRRELPEAKWRSGYSTTRDTDIVVVRIEPAADRSLRVLMTFDSHQDPAQAPPQLRAPCVHWRVAYPLIHQGRVLQLDTGRFPGSALAGPCG